jgi:hypothetical protein
MVVAEQVVVAEHKADFKVLCNTARVFQDLPQSGLVWVHIQDLIQQVAYLD